VTMEVILRAVIGVRDEERLAELAAAVTRLDRIAPVVLPLPILQRDLGRWSPWARMVAAREALDRLVYREIAERRALAGDADDVLSLLVAARHDDGSPMSDRQLRDEVYDLLAAGFETSSASLAWTFERVLRAPAVLERLLDSPGDEYLEAVVKETLRVRPPVTDSTRLLKRATEVAGHSLPRGTQVVVALPLLHLRPSVWSDPHEFRPERWLEGGEGGQPYTFIPFGGGVRRCIGAAFAMLEMKVMLRTVLERARLRAASPEDEAQRLHHVVVVPSRGGRVVLEERIGPAARSAAATFSPASPEAAGASR
jgi:cytochrome P450